MGRSVSYPGEALVVTFADNSGESCGECAGKGIVDCGQCEGTGTTQSLESIEMEDICCPVCDGSGTIDCEECDGKGHIDGEDMDDLIDEFQSHLATLFPSVTIADDWIGREDHVLAENKLARFGMSEYCGLIAYWIVPQTLGIYDQLNYALAERWVRSIADKFVAAFGELSKVGSMSNGEGVYRRIDK